MSACVGARKSEANSEKMVPSKTLLLEYCVILIRQTGRQTGRHCDMQESIKHKMFCYLFCLYFKVRLFWCINALIWFLIIYVWPVICSSLSLFYFPFVPSHQNITTEENRTNGFYQKIVNINISDKINLYPQSPTFYSFVKYKHQKWK